jgi:ABC-2 type transport system permease protein
MISKIYAFLKRDVIEQASYKLSFVSSIFSILLSSATFFFVSKLIPNSGQGVLAKYGGDYFGFVIIGIAFSGILTIFQYGI